MKNLAITAILTLLIVPVTVMAQEDDQEAKRVFNAALEAQQEGDDSTAVTLYQGVIATDPNFTDAYINLGSIYFEKNDYGRANLISKRQPKPMLQVPMPGPILDGYIISRKNMTMPQIVIIL